MTIEKGFTNDLFLQFEYFGICISCHIAIIILVLFYYCELNYTLHACMRPQIGMNACVTYLSKIQFQFVCIQGYMHDCLQVSWLHDLRPHAVPLHNYNNCATSVLQCYYFS